MVLVGSFITMRLHDRHLRGLRVAFSCLRVTKMAA